MPKRGQTKDAKYKAAVERNLKHAKSAPKKYKGLKLDTAKRYIGIRDDDKVHDEAVLKITGKGKKDVESSE